MKINRLAGSKKNTIWNNKYQNSNQIENNIEKCNTILYGAEKRPVTEITRRQAQVTEIKDLKK